jgi:hypothetical protein
VEEPKKHKKKGGLAISQLSRSARPQKRAKDQTQIERTDVNQQSLENVRVSSQMRPSHSAGIVAMRETALEQFPAFAK